MVHRHIPYCAQSISLRIAFNGEYYDEMGLPTAKRLKPDAVPTIFPRSIDYLECSSVSNTSKTKPMSQPLSEKRQQKLVREGHACIAIIRT